MGGAKRMMEEHDEAVSAVFRRLRKAGAVTECEAHEYPLDAGDPAIVEEVRQELASEVGEHEAATLVRQAMDRALENCPGCAAAQRD